VDRGKKEDALLVCSSSHERAGAGFQAGLSGHPHRLLKLRIESASRDENLVSLPEAARADPTRNPSCQE
jgi:hypothetical protein